VNGLVRAEGKLSFRVDNLDSIKLLHPDTGPDVTARHITAECGIALAASASRCGPARRSWARTVRSATRIPCR
jgi:hypothetical protein